jgi:hypothetical protein
VASGIPLLAAEIASNSRNPLLSGDRQHFVISEFCRQIPYPVQQRSFFGTAAEFFPLISAISGEFASTPEAEHGS